MRTSNPMSRLTVIMLVAVFVATTFLPVAAAQVGSLTGGASSVSRSVGQFDVAPKSAGVAQASGAVTGATVSEFTAGGSGTGIIRDYTVNGDAVIDSLNIQGFQATKSLTGQGTSALTLEGNNAVITTLDSINGALIVQNRAAASLQVVADLSAGVTAQATSAQSAAVEIAGRLQGSFVVVSETGTQARGTIDSAQASKNAIQATLQTGESLVFRATPQYDVSGDAQGRIKAVSSAVVQGMAAGKVVAEVTSEFRGAQSLFANADYSKALAFDSNADVQSRVETTIRAAGGASGAAQGKTLAYDLDYPDLPAAADENIAVYVNGVLASRADAAGDVTGSAGAATYYATTIEGRALVLVNTGASAQAAAQRTISIVAVPDANLAARTLAQLNAELGVTSDVQGRFQDYVGSKASGDVAGEFASFFVTKADGAVSQYALVEEGVQVFDKITWEGQGNAEASLDAATHATYEIKGRVTDISVQDSAVATIIADAKADAEGKYELAEGVQAEVVNDQVVELSNGLDVIGHLAIVADKDVDAAGNHLSVGAAGEVVARAAAGSKVVFRQATSAEGEAQARLVAEAMARGDLTNEVSLGVVGNVVETTDVAYAGDTDLTVSQAVRGQIVATLQAEANAATRTRAVLFNADRASLAANSPGDIAAEVKGEAATQVQTIAEAYATAASEGRAAFAVTGGAHAATRQVLVVVPSLAAGAAADILVKSKLEAKNQAAAAVDLFGDLHLDSTTGAATGTIVSFVAKTDASAVLDYTVTTQAATSTVFDAVVVGEGTFDIVPTVDAPSIRFVNPEATLEVFDTTSALLQITATQDTTANFNVAAGLRAVAKSSAVVMIDQASGGATSSIGAIILAKADGSAASSSSLDTSIAGQVNAQLEQNARVVFHAFSGFEAQLDEADKQALAEAMAAGHIAGQVVFQTKAAAAAASEVTLTGHATIEYIQGVDIVTQTASATEIEVIVDSVQSAGRTLILSLDQQTIEGIVNGDAILEIDGEVVARAESYADAVDASNDAGADEYFLHTTDTGHQLLVTLGHFSTRSITLHTPAPTSVFVYTTIALGLVVVGQALYPRIRRKW